MSEEVKVDTTHPSYPDMLDNWIMIDTIRGGTESMRKAGEKYLPKEPRESQTLYENRLNGSVLYNATNKTIETMVGRPFTEAAVYKGTNEKVEEWLNDVDQQGTRIDSFGLEFFDKALAYGINHILVDYPVVDVQLTLEEQQKASIRPYAVLVNPKNLIGWKYTTINGVSKLSQIRISEETYEDDGDFGLTLVKRIRVIEPYRQRVYRLEESGEYSLESDVVTTMPEIPLITLYTNKTGSMEALPPLMDLAYLNVAHWQSYSDQRNILHVARVPLMFASGFTKEDWDDIEVGPNRIIYGPAESDMKYLEHTGSAIEAGRQELQDLKDEMSSLGIELIASVRPGTVTATEKSISSAEADSSLVLMTRGLEHALNEMLLYMGMWADMDEGDVGELSISTDFKLSTQNKDDLDTLWKARMNGDLSVDSFWYELKRRGVLHEDFDEEEEKEKIEDEKESIEPIQLGDDVDDQNSDDQGNKTGSEPTGGTSASMEGSGETASGNTQ